MYNRQPRDPELYRLTRAVALDAMNKLQEPALQAKQLDKRSYYPRFEGSASTYRSVSTSSFGSGATRYTSAFGLEAKEYVTPYVAYETLSDFNKLVNHVCSRSGLKEFLGHPDVNTAKPREMQERWFLISVADLPLELVERHIACVGWEFDEEFFQARYCEMEQWWLDRELPVELLIPIIAVSFEPDAVELGDGCRIERMSDGVQLMRWPGHVLTPEQRALLPCATHALVISNRVLVGPSALGWLAYVGGEPEPEIPERFFEALAVVQSVPSGYMQAVYRPVGWAPGYTGDLPVIVLGQMLDRYPRVLKEGLTEPSAILTKNDCVRLAQVFGKLRSADQSVQLSSRRLRSALLRTDQKDEIIDLCIGLESLVGDMSPGDTTYKLAVRTAAILASKGYPISQQVFSGIKRVYGYRSALVHGKADASKKSITEFLGERMPARVIARLLLQQLLEVFVVDGGLSAEIVDKQFVLGCFDEVARVRQSQDRESKDRSGHNAVKVRRLGRPGRVWAVLHDG